MPPWPASGWCWSGASAVAVRLRYPDRPLGPLLFALAGAYGLQTLLSSPNPYLFTLARAARPAVEVLLIWVMLAFPSGRLAGPKRTFADDLRAPGGDFSLAAGPDALAEHPAGWARSVVCHPLCPRNVLLVADWPALSWTLNTAFRVVWRADPDRHRRIVVQPTAPVRRRCCAAPSRPCCLHRLRARWRSRSFLVTDVSWLASYLTFWAVPLAIALGLLRGRLYTARALQTLVTGLARTPRHARVARCHGPRAGR